MPSPSRRCRDTSPIGRGKGHLPALSGLIASQQEKQRRHLGSPLGRAGALAPERVQVALGRNSSVGEGVEGWDGEEVIEVGHGDSLFLGGFGGHFNSLLVSVRHVRQNARPYEVREI